VLPARGSDVELCQCLLQNLASAGRLSRARHSTAQHSTAHTTRGGTLHPATPAASHAMPWKAV
jgi:hypothetical protein